MHRASVEELTRNLPSKSAKMRALASAGYSRSEIASALGVRYQFVRNVLLSEQARKEQEDTDDNPSSAQGEATTLSLASSGQVILPQSFRDTLGLGKSVIARVDGDEIRIYSLETALRRAREAVRRYVPENVSLADELIAERRRESES